MQALCPSGHRQLEIPDRLRKMPISKCIRSRTKLAAGNAGDPQMKLVTFDSASGLHTGAVVGDADRRSYGGGIAGRHDRAHRELAEPGRAKRRACRNDRKPEFKLLARASARAGAESAEDSRDRPQLRGPHRGKRPSRSPKSRSGFPSCPMPSTALTIRLSFRRRRPQIDYEAELVVVIGKRCRHVSKADAASVVFGYAAGNDVSVRDWQFHTRNGSWANPSTRMRPSVPGSSPRTRSATRTRSGSAAS
jgi:hypothetical protein